MLVEPNCSLRHCVYFVGIEWLGNEEETEVNVCLAFPNGIPDEIAYGNNKHLEPLPGQTNEIVYSEGYLIIRSRSST